MRRYCPGVFGAVLGLGLAATPALAHPHIFVDARATIVFDAAGAVTGIRHEWTFDEAYSSWSIQGLDTNGDGVTSREEMQPLADDNMDGLSQYEYYTFAGEGPDNLKFTHGSNASLDHVDGRTILRFDVDLDRPYLIQKTLEVAINDPEYYVAISFADVSKVTLENAPAGCSVALEPGHDLPPELADQLYALPADVTEIPPDLAQALRGVQGAILVTCQGGSVTGTVEPSVAATALDAVAQLAAARPAPFGGPPKEPGLAMPRTGFLGWVAEQQKSFYQALTAALGRLRADNSAFWVLGTLSFLYGVFHAAGPGHGKVVISSYVLANERQVRRGIVLSFLSAMLQSTVAVVFVLVAALALQMTSLAMSDAANWIGIVSYAMVMLLGLWLVARKIFGWGHRHPAAKVPAGTTDMGVVARAHLHDHDGHGHVSHVHTEEHRHAPHGHEEPVHAHLHVVTADQVTGNWHEQLGVVLAVGLRPCSGALVVLVFALSQGLLAAGIASVFLMGLGTAITVGALATLAVTAKGLARRMLGTGGRLATGLIWWVELLGAASVFGFGLLLLLASF